MSRKQRVKRSVEEKWEIVLEGLRSGNVAESRQHDTRKNIYQLVFAQVGNTCEHQDSAAQGWPTAPTVMVEGSRDKERWEGRLQVSVRSPIIKQ